MESVEINGIVFEIRRITSVNRTASARLKGRIIVISIPARWPPSEQEKVAANLLMRAVKSIEKGRWKAEQGSKVALFHGQRVIAMGMPLDIVYMPAKRFGSRSRDGRVEVSVVESHPRKGDIASRLAMRRIAEEARPRLLERVRLLNERHFGANVPRVTIRDNSSRWGSCSPDGSISLNFRLLFMPQDVLDYVIIHELAHTRYRSHGVRFWDLVEKIVPDHREKRRWLRENGWEALGTGKPPHADAHKTLEEFELDEPY
ncbi:M48 family metallopeptidase [Candidatus Micrarchaeota archaeon]|nr:M48 family metallopeptidase [Candidatus Micrarchaeota archaeon]